MARRQKIPLVIALLVSFIFSGYWQLLYLPKQQKAKAIEPTTPGAAGWNFQFPDSSKNSVKVNVTLRNQIQEFNFSGKTSVQRSKITYSGRDPFSSVPTTGLFYAYALSGLGTPSGETEHPKCKVRQTADGDNQSEQNFYLLVSQSSSGQPYYQQGLATFNPGSNVGEPIYYRFRDNGDITQYCERFNNQLISDFANEINPAGSTLIKSAATINNIGEYCTSLNSNWENLKNGIRGLIQPVPQSNSNWTNDSTSGADDYGYALLMLPLINTATVGAASAMFNVPMSDIENTIADQLFSTTIDYNLTDSGKNAYASVVSLAEQIRTQISAITEQYGSGAWPDDKCKKLRKFKWNKELESDSNVYSTVGEFSGGLEKAFETFVKFQGALDESTSSTGDSCGNPGMKGVGIFAWMICGLGSLTHMIAQKLMTTAMKYLTMSLGANIKLKQPNMPDDSTSQ